MKKILFSFALILANAAGAVIPAPGLPLPAFAGTGLIGEIWQFVDTMGDPVENVSWTNLADAKATLGVGMTPPNATFLATTLDYGAATGSSFDTVSGFLGADAATLSDVAFGARTLRAVYIRISGYIAIPLSPVTQIVEFGTGSDDGVMLRISSEAVSGFDAIRSFGMEAGDAVFAEGGFYPIVIEYFNGPDDGARLQILWDTKKDGTQSAIPVSSLYPIPEPGTLVVAGGGLLLLAAGIRRARS
jgi:hypothetical protein